MTSKNSFWVDMKENNKRRVWLWSISWLVFLLYYVGGCVLTMISANNSLDSLLQTRPAGNPLSDLEKTQTLLYAATQFFGSHVILFLAAFALAVICAIQGFSYLYSRRQVDFYHSLPVKTRRRFAVIWLNGILIYLIPSLVAILGGILIAATQGLMSAEVLNMICVVYAVNLVHYLCVYHLTIIAVMLTGHIVITVFAAVVFQTYELGIQLLLWLYQSRFFDKYPSYGVERGTSQMWLSPYWIYWVKTDWEQISWAGAAASLGSLTLLAMVFLAAGYLLYQKRPAEAAGRAMTFAVTRPVVKVALVVPVALAVTILIQNIVSGYSYVADSGSPWLIVFIIIAASVIGCGLIEVLYEFDIKACFRRKKYFLISAGLAALLYLCFRYDFVQFDAYRPEPDEVESYALTMGNSIRYFDKNFHYQSEYNHVHDNMFLTDTESVLRLAEIQPDNVPGVSMEEAMEKIDFSTTVIYRLNNGRKVERNLWIDIDNPETIEILNRIVGSTEYKKGAFTVAADYFDEWLANDEATDIVVQYQQGAYTYSIPEEEIDRLIEAYRRDLEFVNFTDMTQTLMVGNLFFEKRNYQERSPYWDYSQEMSYEIYIYSDCVQTIACLKDLGFSVDTVIDPEDVMQILVTNHNFPDDSSITSTFSSGYYQYAANTYNPELSLITESYESPEEIREILPALYPTSTTHYWTQSELFDSSYEVSVFFKPDSNPYQHGYMRYDYGVLSGQLPEFVEAETKYEK